MPCNKPLTPHQNPQTTAAAVPALDAQAASSVHTSTPRKLALSVIQLSIAFMLVACGGGGGGDPVAAAPAPAGETPAPPAPPAPPPAATESSTSFQVTGLGSTFSRSLQYRVPGAAAPGTGRPLVIYLHGNGGTSALPAAFKTHTDAQGAILASLQGLTPPGASASNWEFRMDGKYAATTAGTAAATGPDDVEFIKEVIDRATSAANPLFGAGQVVDASKVFVVGGSRGAGMAFVAYADPRTKDKIKAIAPVSGTFYCDIQTANNGAVVGVPVDADPNCGFNAGFGYYGPKNTLFQRAAASPARIFAIWGKVRTLPQTVPASPSEFTSTQLESALNNQYASSFGLWAENGGCERNIASANGVALASIGGAASTGTAYRQRSVAGAATPCTADITFVLDTREVHVPDGYEARIVKWFFGQYAPVP